MEEILEFGIKREGEERRDGGCSVVFDPQTQSERTMQTTFARAGEKENGEMKARKNNKDGTFLKKEGDEIANEYQHQTF